MTGLEKPMCYAKKLATLSLTLLGLTSLSLNAEAQMPPAQVQVVIASERMMAPQIEVSGSIISVNDSRIASEVGGKLDWIAEVGTRVETGDVIARIDERLLAVNMRQAQTNLARLEADLIFREQDVARFSQLASRDNASQARLDEVIARRDMLIQEVANAVAVLERASGDVDRASIKAPFPGYIVARLANIGEYMTVGKEVARLVDSGNIEVVIPAPISITPYLHVGNPVGVVGANQSQMLPIRTVVPVGDRVSRMVEVRLTAPADAWMVGTPVMVSLPAGEPTHTVAVPRDAVMLRGSSFYVTIVDDEMTAQQVRVEISASIGLWVSLTGGVNAGDRVIIRGGERLRPGQSVVIMTEAED
jgi:RND family efflux transporter MFP subunit